MDITVESGVSIIHGNMHHVPAGFSFVKYFSVWQINDFLNVLKNEKRLNAQHLIWQKHRNDYFRITIDKYDDGKIKLVNEYFSNPDILIHHWNNFITDIVIANKEYFPKLKETIEFGKKLMQIQICDLEVIIQLYTDLLRVK